MDCNGIKVRPLNQDCNRIAVKSSVQTTWMMTYKKRVLAKPESYDIAMDRDELLVLSFQDGSGGAEIEIEPLGDRVGTLIAQSSRGPTRTLRVGQKYPIALSPGESIVLRGSNIVHPRHMGAGMSV